MYSSRGKKRSKAGSDSEDEGNGSCKKIAKREHGQVVTGSKRRESFASFLDDSVFISSEKYPLTTSGSFPPQSHAREKSQSDASLSGDSAYMSFGIYPPTPFGSVMPASNVGKLQYTESPSYFSTENLLQRSNCQADLEWMESFSNIDLSTQRKEQRWYYQQNYRFLKELIEPLHKIVDIIISLNSRGDSLSEKMREAKSRELRVDIFLKYSAEHLSQQTFETILKVSDYGHLIDDLRKGTASKPSISRDEDDSHLLSNESFRELLRKELEPKCLIDRLLEHDILSFNDHDDILKTDYRRKRVEILFSYLEYCSKEDHQIFIAILKEECPLILDIFKEDQSALCGECHIEMEIKETDGGWKLPQLSNIDERAKIKVHFEMSPASPDTEMKIVAELDETNMEAEYHQKCLHLKMESLHLGSVIFIYKQLSRNAVQKLKAACESKEINEYVKSLFTAEDIERMKLDNVNTFVLTVTAENHEIETEIPVITKEAIVRNFSFIEKEITDAKVFFAGFLKSGLLTSESKHTLQILEGKSREERNIEFLNLILRGQSGLIPIFQQELARLGYEKILKRICVDNDMLTNDKITEKELKENESYLMGELEPKEFLPALVKILPEEGLNKIMCTVSRRERAKLFLDDVIKTGQAAVDIFVSELKRLDRHCVVEILTGCGTKASVNEELAASKIRVHILDNYTILVDELEPKSFHTFFLERRVIKEETFEKIVKFSTRRNRAVAFLKWLLGEGSTKALIAFQAAARLFCDDVIVKMLEAPMPFMQSGPSSLLADKTKQATELYKATFKVTFQHVSGPKNGSPQVQESSASKEEEFDVQSIEEKACTQFSAQNPKMDEEYAMPFGLNPSLTAGSMQKTKNKWHSSVSSQRSKSKKLNPQNKDLNLYRSIPPTDKVIWWLKSVTNDSISWAPPPNDPASVQVKPFSNVTCGSLGDFSRNSSTESDMMAYAPQDGKSEKRCNGKGEECRRSTLDIRKESDTNMTVPESAFYANISVEENVDVSDQGYISHQDFSDFDQATVSSITSSRLFARRFNMGESSFPTFGESEPCYMDFLHKKRQNTFSNSNASFHPYHNRNSFRDSYPRSLFSFGTCSPYLFSSMGLNVASPLPVFINTESKLNNPNRSYIGLSGIHSFPSPSCESVPSPSSCFDPVNSSPSQNCFFSPDVSSPSANCLYSPFSKSPSASSLYSPIAKSISASSLYSPVVSSSSASCFYSQVRSSSSANSLIKSPTLHEDSNIK